MRRGISWFKGVSAKESVQQEKKYLQKMFPFGQAQKEKEKQLLQELIIKKVRVEDLLYQLLEVKEAMLLEDEEERREEMIIWWNTKLAKQFSDAEKLLFCAMAQAVLALDSLEAFPSANEIREKAGIWQTKKLQMFKN